MTRADAGMVTARRGGLVCPNAGRRTDLPSTGQIAPWLLLPQRTGLAMLILLRDARLFPDPEYYRVGGLSVPGILRALALFAPP